MQRDRGGIDGTAASTQVIDFGVGYTARHHHRLMTVLVHALQPSLTGSTTRGARPWTGP